MEVLNLENQPVLFLPLFAISDHISGRRSGSGINLDIGDNGFFRYLSSVPPTEENLSLALSVASDRADLEPGIVLVAEGHNLAVIGEYFFADDGRRHQLPVIFNAALCDEYSPRGVNYYRAYCHDGSGGYAGEVNIIHDPAKNILWNDDDTAIFRRPW